MNYAKLLIEEGIAPKEKVDTHLLEECLTESNMSSKPNQGDDASETVPNDDSEENEPSTSGEPERNDDVGGDSEAGTNKNPDSRKYIVPNGFRATINNKILRRVFQEMKTIEIDDKPLAVSQITRAFLENLYILFHETVTGSYSTQKTHILIGKVVNEIELNPDLTKAEKDAVGALKRVQSNEHNALSPKTLGANAHAGIYPDSIQLKREFDNISEAIKYMLKRL
jgi:hypothetical protein